MTRFARSTNGASPTPTSFGNKALRQKLNEFEYDIEIVTSNMDFAVILMVSEYFVVVYFLFNTVYLR